MKRGTALLSGGLINYISLTKTQFSQETGTHLPSQFNNPKIHVYAVRGWQHPPGTAAVPPPQLSASLGSWALSCPVT